MIYRSVIFKLNPFSEELSEMLIALLDANNYEGVFQEEDQVTAYIAQSGFEDRTLIDIRDTLKALNLSLSWTIHDIPEQNWNKVWESNFDPVVIGDQCAIRAPFHPHFNEVKHQITIEPKMSFGTGHHFTTRMIIENMKPKDFHDKSVLDMGCGTGVLAIYASKLGANSLVAIDNDKWAYENTKENVNRNNCHNIKVLLGSSGAIPSTEFDIILANINRNILLDQMEEYASHIKPKGLLFLSGIMIHDKGLLKTGAEKEGFSLIHTSQTEKWAMMIFTRK